MQINYVTSFRCMMPKEKISKQILFGEETPVCYTSIVDKVVGPIQTTFIKGKKTLHDIIESKVGMFIVFYKETSLDECQNAPKIIPKP